MNASKHLRLILLLVLLASLSLACGFTSTLSNAASTLAAPPPAEVGTPTGSSPMSGDWGAKTDFGQLTFRIDPDGRVLETMYLDIRNWRCGGDFLTTSMQANTEPPPTVSDGKFQMTINLGDPGESDNELYVAGVYNKAGNKFSGTWEQDAMGTTCSGKWETAAR